MAQKRLSVLVQIIVAFGIPIFLLISLLCYAIYSFTGTTEQFYQVIKHTTARTIAIKTVQDEYHKSVGEVRAFVTYGTSDFEKNAKDHINKSNEIIGKWIPATKSAEIKAEATKLQEAIAEFKSYSDRLIKAKKDNDPNLPIILAEGKLIFSRVDSQLDIILQMQEDSLNKNSEAALDTANRTSRTVLTSSLLLGVLIIIGTVWYGRNLTRRLGALNNQLSKIGDLNFTVDESVNTRNDEIGDMVKNVAHLKTKIRVVVNQINESASHLAAASEQLTAISEQSAQAANQVATTITEVAKGADHQLQSVNRATGTVEQMTASIQQVVKNNIAVSHTSENAAKAAKEGLGAVETAVNQMSSIEKTVNNSAGVVSNLGERSKEIGQIVDTISGIAGQTNLLALNAAIEAARAGEQGRGFAVVADEVRKLAEQSQEAAKQIASLITDIQAETDKAVAAMSEGTREVKIGTEVVHNAGQSFKQIAGLIEQLSIQGQEIAASVQQMGAGSQQLFVAVKEINTVSKNAAAQTQTVLAATEEQSASMEEIAASSQSLAKLAEELQQAIQRFKV